MVCVRLAAVCVLGIMNCLSIWFFVCETECEWWWRYRVSVVRGIT